MEKDIKNINEDKTSGKNLAIKVAVISIIVNIVLCLVKLLAGIIGKSSAMVSDAVHSASDVFSTFVVILGVKLASKKADKKHSYGHERMECIAAIILAIMLAAVGIGIGVSGINKIASGNYDDLTIPSILPLITAIVSIVVKETMFWFTKITAKKVNSGALMADAWHHRSDALSSVGSFIGILFARLGYPIMDAVASIIICLCIIKAAIDIFRDGFNKMVDQSCDAQTEENIRLTILKIDGVMGIDDLKTRLFGDKIYVDIEISVDGTIPLKDAHEIAEKVHRNIEESFPLCKHCMVHVNPSTNKQ